MRTGRRVVGSGVTWRDGTWQWADAQSRVLLPGHATPYQSFLNILLASKSMTCYHVVCPGVCSDKFVYLFFVLFSLGWSSCVTYSGLLWHSSLLCPHLPVYALWSILGWTSRVLQSSSCLWVDYMLYHLHFLGLYDILPSAFPPRYSKIITLLRTCWRWYMEGCLASHERFSSLSFIFEVLDLHSFNPH